MEGLGHLGGVRRRTSGRRRRELTDMMRRRRKKGSLRITSWREKVSEEAVDEHGRWPVCKKNELTEAVAKYEMQMQARSKEGDVGITKNMIDLMADDAQKIYTLLKGMVE